MGDNTDGSPNLHAITAPNNLTMKSVWVGLGPLLSGGRGYVFEAGDQIRFSALTTGIVTFPILYQRLGYIAISAAELNLFFSPSGAVQANEQPLVEIYRPAGAVESTFLYERGPRYPVHQAGTPTASLSVTTGVLPGDCAIVFAAAGATVNLEAMNPSVHSFGIWLDAQRGRPIPVVPNGIQAHRKSLIRFSGVKVAGTLINGLGQWDALNQYDELPQEQGSVVRLTVADQTQTNGSILLVNQERGDVSLSLGQSQIRTADDQPLLSITKSVIGSANALRGGFGCTDAGSVVAYAGKVFWFCARREEVLRYDRNGITPLALTYKARIRIAAAARAYAGNPVRGAFDPRRQEYLLQFPAKINAYGGLTLVYSDRHEAWADELSLHPEGAIGIGNELISWKDGAAWRHIPSAPQGTFFGQYTAPQLTFTLAQPAGVAKQFKDVAIESRSLWLPTFASTDTALTTQMLAPWFIQREGVYRAGLRRAGNSPGFPTVYSALDNGLPLIGTRLTVVLTAAPNASPLTAISISYIPRTGQSMGV